MEEVPLAARIGVGLLLLLTGIAVAAVNRRAADGRLRRNALAGIRTGSTLASDGAWLAGHKAARPMSDVAGAAFALTGVAVALATRADALVAAALIGSGVGTVLLLVATRQAGRAARASGTGA